MADVVLPQLGALAAIPTGALPPVSGGTSPLTAGDIAAFIDRGGSYPLLHPSLLPTFPIINPAPYQAGNDPQVTASPCPLYSAYDYYQLVQFQNLAQQAGYQPQVQQQGLFDNLNKGGFLDMGWIPLEPQDVFRFRAYSQSSTPTVSFFGRILQTDNSISPFLFTLNTDGASTVATVTPQAGPGWLLGAAASVPIGSITNGSAFAIGEIGRSAGGTFTPHTLLFSGQLDSNIPLTSNNPQPPTPVNRVSFDFFNEAAGAAVPYTKTITPPTGYRMRFTRVAFGYQASAVAGTRMPTLLFRKNGNSWQTVLWPIQPTAGQLRSFDASVSGSVATIGNFGQQPLDDTLYFYDSMDVVVLDNNAISGADTLQSMFIRWELS